MLNVLVLPGARATSWRALWPRMGVLEAWAVHQVGPLGAALAGQLGAASPAVVVTRMDSSWAYLMCGWVRLLLRAGLGSRWWVCVFHGACGCGFDGIDLGQNGLLGDDAFVQGA